jgi:hypothetical protein
LSHVSLALGLKGDFAYKRSDVQMLQYLHEQRRDSIALVTAVACGMYHCLWQASKLLQLNNAVEVLIADMVVVLDKRIVLHQQQRAYTGVGEYPGYDLPWLCICSGSRTQIGPREWRCIC